MSQSNIVPSFFVVGTEKGGTTSLHDWLKQQPDVCLPIMKETHFFSLDEYYDKGFEWYNEQFPSCGAQQVIGEICPDYIFFECAAERIAQVNDRPKIVAIFRHPIDRAYSKYRMNLRFGDKFETLDFYDALIEEPDRLQHGGVFSSRAHSYMQGGRYLEQVRQMQRHLPNAEYLFIKFEDLVDRGPKGDETYAKICRFVGVKSAPTIADRGQASNVASDVKLTWVRDFLIRDNPLKTLMRNLIPGAIFRSQLAKVLDSWNRKPLGEAETFAVPSDVVSAVNNEIADLSRETGLDLDDWLSRKFTVR